MRTLPIALMVLLLLPCAYAQAPRSIEDKIEALLAKMTLEEKIGQMNQYNGFWDATGPAPVGGDDKTKYDHLLQGRVGAVLNVVGTERVRELQKVAVEQTRLGIPLLFGLDVIHGFKTLYPIPLAEAASWDLAAIERSARFAAIEASAHGINWTFAPMVDISEDARWGRVAEGAGEDPYLGQEIAKARIHGFQGSDLAAEDTIAACAKHFAGYGFAEAGRDYNRVDASPYTLYNTIFPPFKAAVEADVKTIMNAFNSLNGIPATASAFLQREVLKGQWGFDGFVVSDWASTRELIAHGFAKDASQAAIAAANAGSDMDMEGFIYSNHLKQQVETGAVDVALIDDAVRRILRVKFELGLFEDPYRYVSAERQKQWSLHPEHLAAARDMARKSIVLLKNAPVKKGSAKKARPLLPLKPEQKNIAVIGPLAADKNSPIGTWRAEARPHSAVSLLEGLEQYSENFTYEAGVNFNINEPNFSDPVIFDNNDRSGIAKAKALAEKSDLVIMLLGEHGFQSGEGRSRTQLGLPGLQQELLEEIHSVNNNIVLLVASGRPLVLTWADRHIPAIVQTWQLGLQSGHAIADVLFGEYNPSGKLPMSFPRSVGQLPISYRAFSTGRPEPLETVFWSHYNDERNDPLYPFGHGLSYTEFGYSKLQVNAKDRDNIKVQVTVTNTGRVAGEEVVQLYLRDQFASYVRPVKELKGFQKIHLEPGEARAVNFLLTEKELGFYNSEGDFLVEPGEFEVMVGGSSDIRLTEGFALAQGM